MRYPLVCLYGSSFITSAIISFAAPVLAQLDNEFRQQQIQQSETMQRCTSLRRSSQRWFRNAGNYEYFLANIGSQVHIIQAYSCKIKDSMVLGKTYKFPWGLEMYKIEGEYIVLYTKSKSGRITKELRMEAISPNPQVYE